MIMVCFFKSIDTFETIGQAIVSEYAVPLASANGSTGSVTVPGELTQDYTRQWLVLGDRLLYITAVTPMDNMTTITVGDALTAFNRTIAYVEPTTYYLGEYIKSLAESEYINQSDPFFDMPYLTATNSDTTEFAHITPKDFITSLESVARSAQARGVSIVFSFDADSVTMSISTANATAQAVVMGDGHSQLVSEEYNREQISKVTVVSVLGYPHDYYLTLTGEIVTEAPVNRPPGEWITVTQGADNLLDTAKEAFATSVNSHKIVFFSTLELALFQPLLMRLNGKLYETSITYVGIQSSDRRYLYECGDAATTLTDKVAALSRATAQIGSSIPTHTSQLQNDAGFVDASEAAAAAPVQSVNGSTGDVTVTVPANVSELVNDAGYISSSNRFVNSGGYGPMGFGYFHTSTQARIFVPMPNTGGSFTAVTYSGTLELLYGNGSHTTISGMGVVGRTSGGIIVTVSIASGGTQYMPCVLRGAGAASITATFS